MDKIFGKYSKEREKKGACFSRVKWGRVKHGIAERKNKIINTIPYGFEPAGIIS